MDQEPYTGMQNNICIENLNKYDYKINQSIISSGFKLILNQ